MKNKIVAIWRKLPPFYTNREDEKLPWVKTWNTIHVRCNYKGYRGIKNKLTPLDLRNLYVRDGAMLMSKPTIDRKNPDKNYTFSNCRYVEHSFNSGRARNTDKKKKVFKEIMRKLWKDPKFRKMRSENSRKTMIKINS